MTVTLAATGSCTLVVHLSVCALAAVRKSQTGLRCNGVAYRTSGVLLVMVYKDYAGGKGKGLFASRDIHEGEVVIKMRQAKYVHRDSIKGSLHNWWAAFFRTTRMKEDGAIWVRDPLKHRK